ncbi:MAG TPA: tetratricopeptide repeat protein [Pyrinomonadaceae bacterium]|jgi:tetratricopeptide (TPR) repeat protein
MKRKYLSFISALVGAVLIFTATASAQSGSTRPRRVNPQPAPSSSAEDNRPTTQVETESPAVTSQPVARTNRPRAGGASDVADTSRAFSLLQQKQYAAAAREAKQLAASYPNDSETWKIAGFAEMNLKQYAEAAADLQRALDLQRAAGKEDPFTVDMLAQAYVLTEKFDLALPLLKLATTRTGQKADAGLLYYRGLAEFRTGQKAEAERTFTAVVKDNPRDAASLYFLGQLAYERNDLDAAISALNRATLSDARSASAWSLLTTAYLRRAAMNAANPTKADADYLNAVRAGEGLTRIKTDQLAMLLFGQALVGAKQFARAATTLERAAAGADANGAVLYWLGIAHSRAKNFPKAIAALERASASTPDDVNIYRELGYAYEVSKQYAKALGAYQKGAELAPGDADFQASVERVKPYAQ